MCQSQSVYGVYGCGDAVKLRFRKAWQCSEEDLWTVGLSIPWSVSLKDSDSLSLSNDTSSAVVHVC